MDALTKISPKTRNLFIVCIAFCFISFLFLLFPTQAHADGILDWITDPVGTLAENAMNALRAGLLNASNALLQSVSGLSTAVSPKNALNGQFDSLFSSFTNVASEATGSGSGASNNVYKTITACKTAVIVLGQSILAFALLMQLVKISQRVDGNAALPMVKEIVILAVFFMIGSYLVNHSFDICGAAYEEIRKVIQKVSLDANSLNAVQLDSNVDVDFGGACEIFLLTVFMWLTVLVGSIISVAVTLARALQIYVMAACSPIPFSLMMFDETRQMGIGFCKNFIGVCLAGLIIIVLITIYPSICVDLLTANAVKLNEGTYLLTSANLHVAAIYIAGASVMYILGLLKSGSWARDIMGG